MHKRGGLNVRHAFLIIIAEGFLPGRDTEKVDEEFQKWDLRCGSN